MMRKLISKAFWGCVWAVAIFASFYVYYYKYPEVRVKVDARVPVVKEIHSKIVALLNLGDNSIPPAVSTAAAATPAQASPTPEVAAVLPATPPTVPPAAVPSTPPASDTVDIAQLSQSRAEWPKMVSLKKIVEFPAVLDGRVVGKIKAPPGTQAHLMLIKDGKAGVEFQGGGAMVEISDTDLIERVQMNRHAGLK